MRFFLALFFCANVCYSQVSTIAASTFSKTQLARATTPSVLVVQAVDKSNINLAWQDIGATTYSVERSTSSDYSGASTIYSGSSTSYADTGLSTGTTYYYRVRAALSGYSVSDWATGQAKTISFTPKAWYEFTGLDYSTGNNYGTTASSSYSVDDFKSIINTGGPLLSYTSGGKASVTNINSVNPYPVITNTAGYYNSASDWVFTGDFTIAIRYVMTVSGSAKYIFSRVGGSDYIQNFTNLTGFAVNINGTGYNIFSTATMVQGTTYDIVFRRVSNQFSMSIDGGATYSGSSSTPGTTVTVTTADFTLNRVFASNGGGNNLGTSLTRIVMYDGGTLSAAQCNEVFNYLDPFYGVTFTPDAMASSASPRGLTFTTLTNGRWTDDTSAADNCAGPSRRPLWSIGDLHILLSNKINTAPDYSAGTLRAFKNSSGGSNVVSLGALSNDTDIHNVPSGFLFNNRFYIQNASYQYGDYRDNYVVRCIGKDFDFRGVSTIPSAKQIPQRTWNGSQYHDTAIINDVPWGVSMEYATTFPRYIVMGKTTKDFAFWDSKTVIVDASANPNWPYPYLIYNGTRNEMYLCVIHYNTSLIKYQSVSFIRSSDGVTWKNLDNSYSKNVVTGGALTLTELEANCVIFDATALAYDAIIGNVLVTSGGEVYGTISNGLNTKWRMFKGTVGSPGWTITDITWGGKTVMLDTTPATSGTAGVNGFNRSYPVIYKESANTYSVIGLEVNGGDWRAIRVKTTDNGSNWSYIEDISPTSDPGAQYLDPKISTNYEYNTYAAVRLTRATSSTAGTNYIKEIKTP